MSEDGLREAEARIAKEAEAQTGVLNLAGLGLTKLPESLFALTHLRILTLGIMEYQISENGDVTKGNWTYLNGRTNHISNLTGLEAFTKLHTLYCGNTQVSDLGPLSGLSGLHTLYCGGTRVSDLRPLSGLSGLHTLECGGTPVSDLRPLSGLSGLKALRCDSTQVSDLSPLSGLSGLETLNCSSTQVSDLRPLSGLSGLETLHCSHTQVSDLGPLSGLSGLETLNCSSTQVSDLGPLSGLSGLHTLDCSSTQVSDLGPLSGLSGLHTLYCMSTQVSDLRPLSGLSGLHTLHCSGTEVSDLGPLSGLSGLHTLHCDSTQVSDLSPIEKLANLRELNLSYCKLSGLPDNPEFYRNKRTALIFAKVRRLPSELIVEVVHPTKEQADRLFAHFKDLQDGHVSLPRAKLVVLGNGRVGKTQLVRRLTGEDYDTSVSSTHGIQIETKELPTEPDRTDLNIWDFGGQDVYLGTHGLFLRTRAIFVICWAPGFEDGYEDGPDGLKFPRHPRQYWLNYVKTLAGTDMPVLLVQSQCEATPQKERLPQDVQNQLDGFGFSDAFGFGAANDYGLPDLEAKLKEAVGWLNDQHGTISVGKGRLEVMNELERMRDEDKARAKSGLEKRYPTISRTYFDHMCEQAGGIYSTEHFLSFLNNSGQVFWNKDMFEGQIVLDQSWALDAIYSIFDRKTGIVGDLLRNKGRFDRRFLNLTVWRERTPDEQNIFLSMMESCGIAFTRYRSNRFENEYIAPDFLPERAAMNKGDVQPWGNHEPDAEIELKFDFLHPAYMRSLIASIGKQVKDRANYWRTGVALFDVKCGGWARIECKLDEDGPGGRIQCAATGHEAMKLLKISVDHVEQQARQMSLKVANEDEVKTYFDGARQKISGESVEEPQGYNAVAKKTSEYTRAVSYAWNTGAKDYEIEVDRLMSAAEDEGIKILRDKADMGLGDKIDDFMKKIAVADRVFVFLSEKYLKSPFCMYELYSIWKWQSSDPDKFNSTIRVFILDDASEIYDLKGRIKYINHWKKEFEETKDLVGDEWINLSELDKRRVTNMQGFSNHIGPILSAVTDTLQPGSWEDFLEYGFK